MRRETSNLCNKEFVYCTKKTSEQAEAIHMRVIKLKGNDIKWKIEEKEKEPSSLGIAVKTLYEKKNCLGKK